MEGEADVDVGVRALLVRQLDVEADRDASAFARSAVRGLHEPRPAARHDRESGLGEAASDLDRGRVVGMPLADARGAEDRHRGLREERDRLEALVELVGDPSDVLPLCAAVRLEKPPVVQGQKLRSVAQILN